MIDQLPDIAPNRLPELFELRGTPVSGGIVAAPVRILRNEQDACRVRPGEVLVCACVTPDVMSLFGVAAGVIAEAGGALSNPAIVARECRIPGVFAVRAATYLLCDGQPVTVDGTRGVITARGPLLANWRANDNRALSRGISP
jgi:pyruvate,water dikinase